MDYFKNVEQMKEIVEERKRLSSTERGLRCLDDARKRIERKKRIEQERQQIWDNTIEKLVDSRPLYQSAYEKAMDSKEEEQRVVYKDILSLIDNISSLSDKVFFSDLEALIPSVDGIINFDEVKDAMARISSMITSFVRIK